MITETALEVAVDVAAYFAKAGHPYVGRPVLDLDGLFALVTVWDDEREVLINIACVDFEHMLDAKMWVDKLTAALSISETTAVGAALCRDSWMGDDPILSIPIRDILGGEA